MNLVQREQRIVVAMSRPSLAQLLLAQLLLPDPDAARLQCDHLRLWPNRFGQDSHHDVTRRSRNELGHKQLSWLSLVKAISGFLTSKNAMRSGQTVNQHGTP